MLYICLILVDSFLFEGQILEVHGTFPTPASAVNKLTIAVGLFRDGYRRGLDNVGIVPRIVQTCKLNLPIICRASRAKI